MRPENRIKQALKVVETGGMCQFDKDSNFAQALRDLLARNHELEQSFDLRWNADKRAIKRWREANPGNDLIMPDHADLCVWLLDERKADD